MEKKTQSTEQSSDTGKDQRQAVALEKDAAEPVSISSFDEVLAHISKDDLEKAEALGVSHGLITSLFGWAKGVDSHMQILGNAVVEIGKKMPTADAITEKMMARLEQERQNAQQRQIQNQQAQGPQQGSETAGSGDIALLKALLGGGESKSSGDAYFTELGKEMASLGVFVTKETLKRMIPEAMSAFEEEAKKRTAAKAVTT